MVDLISESADHIVLEEEEDALHKTILNHSANLRFLRSRSVVAILRVSDGDETGTI